MSHSVIIWGRIEGGGPQRDDDHRHLEQKNEAVIRCLPDEDEWPWLVRRMFALPAPRPQGTFRDQIIHFGASFKDDEFDRSCWDLWLKKYEQLLSQMYWWSASLYLETELEADRLYWWIPDSQSIKGLADDQPIASWTRHIRELRDEVT